MMLKTIIAIISILLLVGGGYYVFYDSQPGYEYPGAPGDIVVTIHTPLNNSYTNDTTPLLNATSAGTNLNGTWYSVDGGTNQSSGCDLDSCLVSLSSLSEAAHNVTVYTNSTGGNESFAKHFFTVDSVKSSFTFVPPTAANDSTININHTYVNVTVTDTTNTSAYIDWNQSLVGYWNFDSYNSTGVYDNSTYSNFGAFDGGLGTSNLTTGKYGKGLEFDGTDDYVDCGNDSSLFPDVFTVEAWVKIDGGNQNSVAYWGAWDHPMVAPCGIADKSIIFLSSENYRYFQHAPVDVDDGNWHHVAFVVTGNGQNDIDNSKMYADGQEQTVSSTQKTNSPASKSLLKIGKFKNCYFNGTIDEVRIYNRVLSPQEINASFNNGAWRLENNYTGLSDGSYEYYAGAIDSTGNLNISETRILTVDTTPLMVWYTPADDNSTIVSSTLTHNITFTDAYLYMLNCTIYNDSAMTYAMWSYEVDLTGNTSWTLEDVTDVSGWGEGTYYENCTITDND